MDWMDGWMDMKMRGRGEGGGGGLVSCMHTDTKGYIYILYFIPFV